MTESVVTDIRKIKSREALRAAMLSLLAEKTFDQITTRDITSAARVGYATFYRHYETKEVLLNTLAKEQVDALLSMAVPVLDPENSLAACAQLCRYIDDNRSLWTALLVGGAAGAIKEELMGKARDIAATWPGLDETFPADLGISLIVSATVELIVWWLSQDTPLPAEQVAQTYHRMIVAPAVSQWLGN